MKDQAAIIDGKVVRFDADGVLQSSLTGTNDAELDQIIADVILNHTGVSDDAARNVFDFVRTSYGYRFQDKRTSWDDENNWMSWSPDCVKDIYYNGSGNCYRFASMTTWTLRALGYDARMRLGYVPGWGQMLPHAWTEVHLADGSALVVDSELAMERNYPSHNWFMVPYSQTPLHYRDLDQNVIG